MDDRSADGSWDDDMHITLPGRRALAALAVAATLVGGVGCTDAGRAGGSTTSDATAADPTGSATSAPTSVDTTASGPAESSPSSVPAAPNLPVSLTLPAPAGEPGAAYLSDLIDLLVVAPETSGDGYERELFGSGWIDADGDGCDTRAEVLIEESTTLAQVDAFGCGVVTGDWTSAYDGVETTNPGDLDIDHVVALGEAWGSGASRWDEATRLAFANHLDEPRALVAVTASANRSKSDRDPAEWQPPSQAAWCGYVGAWASVKAQWALTADQAEIDALRAMASAC